MQSKLCSVLVLFFYPCFLAISQPTLPCRIQSGQGDITTQLEAIVNIPVNEGITGKARNIWDLINFNDKIYIAFGSTVQNSGPISLYSLDVNNNLVLERSIPAEAIEKFRIHNQKLYVPNSDPLGGQSDLDKFSMNESNVWTDESWAPSLAHTRDMLFFKDSLYLIGNSWDPISKLPNRSGVHLIDENLNNLVLTELASELNTSPYNNPFWNWFFGGFEYNDTLVLPNALLTKEFNPLIIENHPIAFVKKDTMQWSRNMTPGNQLKHIHLYPVDTTVNTTNLPGSEIIVWPSNSVVFDQDLFLTYRTYSLNNDYYQDQYNNSAGGVFKSSLTSEASFINLPDKSAVVEDLLVYNNELYVLANRKLSSEKFLSYVFKTSSSNNQIEDWINVLHFTSPNMVRSFELLDEYFYFGLGSNLGDRIEESGQLYRYKNPCNPFNCISGTPCDDNNVCTINDSLDNNCDCYGTYEDSNNNNICDPADCVNYLFINGNVTAPSSIFESSDVLESDAKVQNALDTYFRAQNSLFLLPGFETRAQENFTAEIRSCN